MTNRSSIALALFLSLSLDAMAQTKAPAAGGGADKIVFTALTAVKANNFDEARQEIDKAYTAPDTKSNPKVLLAKAQIYCTMNNVDKYKDEHLYRDGAKALFKLVDLKPDYEKATVDQLLLFAAYQYYNDGVKAYTDRKFDDAIDLMKNVVKVHDMGGGKRFEKFTAIKQYDTVAADATLAMANGAYYSKKYDEAIPMLISAKNNPITKAPSVYQCLIEAYKQQNNTKDAYAAIEEGRAAFPDDVTLRNFELNYYITAGKQNELLKKLEDIAVKEPNNADIFFNIATTYSDLANAGEGKKPANASELISKSEEAFQHALKLAPENGAYNYNFGTLYFDQGADINDQMNAITGSSATDLKKYDELKPRRDAFFSKSAPYFEKAYSIFSPNESNLKGEDMKNYKTMLQALQEIYEKQNKADKAAEMKRKLESMK